eukprot:TRINITY_DN10748_c0_g1_i1.p1 TRINITY_DN10748_c0_g1~~TRINITY_DN10748_c0_g1_i1.p1  ORF type:complete len:239 (+),score=32.37 TRINITY_DN10748_c0_g1_i1:76-717(+)
MARRGIANYDAPGVDENDDRWWRELWGKDGFSDATAMLSARSSGPSNYVGMESTTTANSKIPWVRARPPGDRTGARGRGSSLQPTEALASSTSAWARAGKSSWHHNVRKPACSKIDTGMIASASFFSPEVPHLAAEMTPRRTRYLAPMENGGLATDRSPREGKSAVATASATRRSAVSSARVSAPTTAPMQHTNRPQRVNALGFEGTFCPRLY